MAKKWQVKELDSLKRSAASKSLAEWAQTLGREESDVQAKLQELEIACREDGTPVGWYDDPIVERFDQALKTLHGGDWKKAHGELQKIVAESDVPEVAEKARQMVRVCESRLGKTADTPKDPFLDAVYEKNRGNYAAALAICDDVGKAATEDRYAYLIASIHALADEAEQAVTALQTAVQLNPKNRVYAFHDPDFEGILDRPELEQFFEAS